MHYKGEWYRQRALQTGGGAPCATSRQPSCSGCHLGSALAYACAVRTMQQPTPCTQCLRRGQFSAMQDASFTHVCCRSPQAAHEGLFERVAKREGAGAELAARVEQLAGAEPQGPSTRMPKSRPRLDGNPPPCGSGYCTPSILRVRLRECGIARHCGCLSCRHAKHTLARSMKMHCASRRFFFLGRAFF